MGKSKRPRKSSWSSVHGGVEINYDDVHIVVSPLPTREAKLDEILQIEDNGSGWRLPTEKEAQQTFCQTSEPADERQWRRTVVVSCHHLASWQVRMQGETLRCPGTHLLYALWHLLLELVDGRQGFPSSQTS